MDSPTRHRITLAHHSPRAGAVSGFGGSMATYKIIRFYQRDNVPNRVIKTGLTLEEAQAHCSDPETSSSTAKRTAGNQRTKTRGPWFDGYNEE
jgi:hypothetical protein